ncbi:MAG TPA: nucleotide exchange factor GrpE, partial [candidate division Zixibacteria bacterium]|nr:nucleotide exchange factor GrpE [candidate division Zixibacteria bacterium]
MRKKDIEPEDPVAPGGQPCESVERSGSGEAPPAAGVENGDAEPGPPPGEIPEEEQLRRRIAELEDRLLRTAADFDNYRKRQARQYDELVKTAADRVLSDLLDIVDNFRRALDAAAGEGNMDAYRQGTELIYGQMTELLARYDVTPIEAVGRPFDPNVHEALLRVPSAEHPAGTVAVEVS